MKLSAKNIQLFVAGAIAISGFRGLVTLPSQGWDSKGIQLAVTVIMSFIGLLIGVAMLVGKAQAIRWARIYLGVSVTLTFVMLDFALVYGFSRGMPQFEWKYVSAFAVPLVPWLLLLWSGSKRFRIEPDDCDHAA